MSSIIFSYYRQVVGQRADGARGPRVTQAEGSGRPLGEAFPLVVGAQRVAPRRAEFEAIVELRAGQVTRAQERWLARQRLGEGVGGYDLDQLRFM